MKIAVISDIHGNLSALEAVIADAEKRGVDEYIFAGDYCLSGPQPNECINIIRQIENKHIIRGNGETYLDNLVGKDQSKWTDGQMQITYWCYRNLYEDNLKYLLELPHTINLDVNGVNIHVAHSSVPFIGDYEMGRYDSITLETMRCQRNISGAELYDEVLSDMLRDAELQNRMSNLEDGLYIFGHTHVQWMVKANDRGVTLVNPGSCGLPLDGIESTAPYAMITVSANGEADVEQIRVPFDFAQYVENIKESSMYREANVWCKVIFREFYTARETIWFFLGFVEEYAQSIGDETRPFSLETWENAYEKWTQMSN